jgi:hypothetical protein
MLGYSMSGVCYTTMCGTKALITQQVELPMVGLIVVKITLTISKTSYKDLGILDWMPIMVFVP